MKVSNTAQRLKEAMDLRNLKQSEIIEKTGMNKGALSSYLSGRYEPKQDNIYILSSILNVNEAWLMGYDVPMEKNSSDIDIFKYDNIHPITTQKIPFLGEIACGQPIFADEERESYIEVGIEIKADFCLRCKGDSMVNARIYDGDIVFIRKQDVVENGEIAAVIIDNETTLKRVYYYKESNLLILRPENNQYKEMQFSGEELNSIRILGKAVAFQGDVK